MIQEGTRAEEVIRSCPEWYHSIELAPGITTPGRRPAESWEQELRNLRLPDLKGKTVLDIGAYDGFFSFAAERLGAARVTALDHYVWFADMAGYMKEWRESQQTGASIPAPHESRHWRPEELPGRRPFDAARALFGSRVEPVVGDFMTMDLSPLGRFDVVLLLGVLYHLEEPLRAARRLASVTAPGGLAVIETEAVEVPGLGDSAFFEFFPGQELNNDPSNWWAPNAKALEGLCRAAGFRAVTLVGDPPASPWRPLHARLWGAVKHLLHESHLPKRLGYQQAAETASRGCGIGRLPMPVCSQAERWWRARHSLIDRTDLLGGMMMKRTTWLAALGGALLTVTPGWADPITYDMLEESKHPGASITVGVLTFSHFADLGGTSSLKDTNVVVIPTVTGAGTGLMFNLSLAASGPPARDFTATFGYQVDSNSFDNPVVAAALSFDGRAFGADGLAEVTEDVNAFNAGMVMLHVFQMVPGTGGMAMGQNNDAKGFDAGTQTLVVSETAHVASSNTIMGSSGAMDHITNLFFPVPAPPAGCLFLAGGLLVSLVHLARVLRARSAVAASGMAA